MLFVFRFTFSIWILLFFFPQIPDTCPLRHPISPILVKLFHHQNKCKRRCYCTIASTTSRRPPPTLPRQLLPPRECSREPRALALNMRWVVLRSSSLTTIDWCWLTEVPDRFFSRILAVAPTWLSSAGALAPSTAALLLRREVALEVISVAAAVAGLLRWDCCWVCLTVVVSSLITLASAEPLLRVDEVLPRPAARCTGAGADSAAATGWWRWRRWLVDGSGWPGALHCLARRRCSRSLILSSHELAASRVLCRHTCRERLWWEYIYGIRYSW